MLLKLLNQSRNKNTMHRLNDSIYTVIGLILLFSVGLSGQENINDESSPNVVLIFMDNFGWG